ncbi:sulfite exporter TauE/SafE family protein [Thorsellia anophelis]|uniref:Probable membrane transporter protein n=1 Tax=Thorsellia anophelis DSM 18579 TaxID=1123402 RepID=A0A1I0E9V8_9GAMM|nr:sulfite exporter TauE/SafE family protein [Thorsellia anophelis]SET41833.1 hypothetical protein SAMN02583745_02302 [Thorsellia anophelis DSM 18579]
MIIIYCLGILVGLVLGLTGAGGGIIAIPVLMYGLNWDLLTAGPVALIAIAFGAWVGAYYAYQQGMLNFKAGIIMALFGMPITPLGQLLARSIPYWILLILFIFVIFIVAIRMWMSTISDFALRNNQNNHSLIEKSSSFLSSFKLSQSKLSSFSVFIFIGMVSGLMTGLLSVGGGFIIVPLLTQLTKLNIKQASATSLLVIAIISTVGVISAEMKGAHFPMPFTIWFTITVIIGLLLGRRITQHLSDKVILRSFSILLILVALMMLSQYALK